ncbi:MAG: hypothetical protein OER22_11675 [Gammaproteobacteria bacterium]|nr:hypothetical protein [Gammaproteobacteria bacterium]MDH3372314.1 hypothetical protein [Gammaproteobacteria bacterium]MDH3409696.1 hypothetical protein [Gammaproteobacteria bacterium]MDH3553265.1 hypothetical protein [Gammaproteobacteria bacterium]
MTLTPTSSRTITGYLSELLEFPRLFIERDVDFTNCRVAGRFDEDSKDCTSCKFGVACQWLNRERTPSTDAGSVEQLVEALQTAEDYLRTTTTHSRSCDCETCSWLREARHFLHARSHWA